MRATSAELRGPVKAQLRLLVVGSPGGTAMAVAAKALARGHRVTPRATAHALAGHDAIVADETVGSEGVRRLVTARVTGARVVLVTRDDAAVDELFASGLDWTIARPAPLTDGGLGLRYRIANGTMPERPRPISRADLAHFLLHGAAAPPAHDGRRLPLTVGPAERNPPCASRPSFASGSA